MKHHCIVFRCMLRIIATTGVLYPFSVELEITAQESAINHVAKGLRNESSFCDPNSSFQVLHSFEKHWAVISTF